MAAMCFHTTQTTINEEKVFSQSTQGRDKSHVTALTQARTRRKRPLKPLYDGYARSRGPPRPRPLSLGRTNMATGRTMERSARGASALLPVLCLHLLVSGCLSAPANVSDTGRQLFIVKYRQREARLNSGGRLLS